MTANMSAAQQRQQTNRAHDGRYAEGGHAEPDIDLGTRLEAGPPAGTHASSVQAYRDHIEDLQRQLADARVQQARHELAQFAAHWPDARYLTVAGGYGDDGEPVVRADEAFDPHGRSAPISAAQRSDLSAWEAPRDGTLEDFTVEPFTEIVDLNEVSDWSARSTPATPHGLAGQQATHAQRTAEHATLRGMAGDVRQHFPRARFVHVVTENDLGSMAYESVTDQNGEVLHENDGSDDHAGFTETMERWSESLDKRGSHWTDAAADTSDGVAVYRDRRFGQVQSATLDLNKVETLSR